MFEIVQLHRNPETSMRRYGRLALGTFMLGVGGFLVVIFTIAVGYELTGGTMFGLLICIMVITFGVLILRDGIAQLTGLRVRLRPNGTD